MRRARSGLLTAVLALGLASAAADQESYEFLQSGAAVTIEGVVTPDGNRMIADTITPDR